MNDVQSTYPVRVDAALDPSLSRLWLVKWLLVLPHYLALSIMVGGGLRLGSGGGDDAESGWGLGGLVGPLVLVAAVVLLFTGRHTEPVHRLVMGMDRWSSRVTAYAALTTDAYPRSGSTREAPTPAAGTAQEHPPVATPPVRSRA